MRGLDGQMGLGSLVDKSSNITEALKATLIFLLDCIPFSIVEAGFMFPSFPTMSSTGA